MLRDYLCIYLVSMMKLLSPSFVLVFVTKYFEFISAKFNQEGLFDFVRHCIVLKFESPFRFRICIGNLKLLYSNIKYLPLKVYSLDFMFKFVERIGLYF